VHGCTERGDLSADAKVRWLVAQDWLFEVSVRQEAFHLLAQALPLCSSDVVSALVATIKEQHDGKERHPRTVYDLLHWIARHAPSSDVAQQAFEGAQRAHPEWTKRPHSGFVAWHEGGRVGPQPPVPVDKLAKLLREGPDLAVSRLLAFEDADWPWDGPTWADAVAVLAEVVIAEADLGSKVLDTARDHPDLIAAAVRGWAAATLKQAQAAHVPQGLQTVVNAALRS